MTDIGEVIARVVRASLRNVAYLRSYGVEVQYQHEDGAVDVLADAVELRGVGLQRVQILVSPAGTITKVAPGTRGLLSFADGDPRKPRIVAWEYKQSSASNSIGGGHAGVARNGDLVELLLSEVTPISGLVSATVQTPNPSPPPPTLPLTVPAGSQFTGTATLTDAVRGRIFGGAQRVKA